MAVARIPDRGASPAAPSADAGPVKPVPGAHGRERGGETTAVPRTRLANAAARLALRLESLAARLQNLPTP